MNIFKTNPSGFPDLHHLNAFIVFRLDLIIFGLKYHGD